jgi:RNA-directed DNA polymerase
MNTPSRARKHKVHLVRYADDFIITGTSEVLLKYEVQPLVAHFLAERGLELSHEKTSITHLQAGFDFLSQTVRRYRSGKVLLKPSRRSVQTFFQGIQETIEQSGSMTAGDLIWRLNQQIKGWTMYHRHAASKRTFSQVDRRIFRLVWHWCRKRHRRRSWKWIKERYFQANGHRHWIFTGKLRDRNGKEWPIALMEAGKVSIRRQWKICGEANPYDPAWEPYLEERLVWRLEGTLAGRSRIEYFWKGQGGRCTVCGQLLRVEDRPWHLHHRLWRSHGGQDTFDNLELLHANCHRQVHTQAKN